MSTRRGLRRAAPLVAGLAGLSLVMSACGGSSGGGGGGGGSEAADCSEFEQYGTFDGAEVTVYSSIREAEGETLASSFDAFAECTDTEISYEGSGEFEAQLTVRVEGDNAPDIAFMPQPGLLQRFAESGDLIPAPDEVEANVDANWSPEWKEYGSAGGEFYAAPLGANVKSFVWYSPSMFEEAGYEVPTTLDELKALSDQIVADGAGKPWCAGIESGDATGWVATDWLEDFMLRTAGPEVYDQWVNHEIPFNDPQVVEALDAAGEYLKNEEYMNGGYGDVQSITTTAFQDGGLPILDGDCWLHRQASFYASNWPDGTEVAEDGDVYAFYLPAESADGEQPVLGAGEFVAAFSDRPEVVAFQTYLSTMEYVERRASLEPGSWVTAAKGVDPSLFNSDIDRLSYEILQDPEAVFRFDGSDLMPAEIGAAAFWAGMTDWINGDSTKESLDSIEAAWPTS